jgi:hypothetical protein
MVCVRILMKDNFKGCFERDGIQNAVIWYPGLGEMTDWRVRFDLLLSLCGLRGHGAAPSCSLKLFIRQGLLCFTAN